VTLSADEVLRGVDVVIRLNALPQNAVIVGRAVDGAGRPIVGTKVELLGYSRRSQISLGAYSDHPELTVLATRDTDDRGEYRIIDVRPGQYFLRVPPPGRPQDELSPLGATFYPGVTGLTRAKTFEVRAGEELRLGDIVLTPSTLLPILVRTIDATGGNARGSLLSLFGGPAPDHPPSTTGVVGGVPAIRPDEPGNYMVCAGMTFLVDTPIRFAHTRNACTDVVYTGDRLEITLTIAKAVGNLNGRVLVESEDGIGTATPLAGASIGGIGVGPGTNYGGTSDANGYFQGLHPIPDGPVRLRALNLPEGYYVASIHQGSRDALHDGVLVAGQDTNLDVRVRKGVGRLTGVITGSDGRPVDYAVVTLIPEGELAQRPDKDNTHRTTKTNLNGTFEIRNIIPGRYRAYALAKMEDGAHLDAQFFKPFAEQSTLVEISKDSDIVLKLSRIEPRDIEPRE
jgi:protocatechuate 3,4-dioxygenase beta subunit